MSDIKLVLLVAAREVKERIQTRSFLILTVLVILLSGGGVVALDVLPDLFEKGPKQIGVVTSTPDTALDQQLQSSAGAFDIELEIEHFADRSSGEGALRDGKIDALLIGEQELLFESDEDEALHALVNNALYRRSLPLTIEALGLTLDEVRPLIEPEGVSVALLEPATASEAADSDDRRFVASIAVVILYISLALYGQWLLMGVIEEKTSRVVEVLLGALRPEHLLSGKVLGIVAVAMLQLASVLVSAGLALAIVGSARIPSVALDVAVVSVLFFVLGIIAYSFLYATVGATVSRQSEASSAAAPIVMVLLVPYFLSLTIVPDNPDSLLARLLSLLPPTAPLAMPTRVATGDPNLIEIVAAMVLMLPWIAFVIWLAARVYTGAILRSGPRVGLLTAWRAANEIRRD